MKTPLRFEPKLKVRVWGGSVLPQRLGAEASEPIGESWELCDHDEDVSVVAEGLLKGKTLRELWRDHRNELAGKGVDPHQPERFPLMLKLLDAQQVLSVQVHPDDEYAAKYKAGELGKTEAWYILEADEGAHIYRGVRDGVTEEGLKGAIENGTVGEVLKKITVKPGEVYFIPAGMIHALGSGARIAEIQQNSDTTFRLFDWNRTGLDGKPRELHVTDGVAVSRFDDTGPDWQEAETLEQSGCIRERFISCEKFAFERLREFATPARIETQNVFHIITTLQGRVSVATAEGRVSLGPWQTCLVPAACGSYEITGDANAAALLFYIPVEN